MPKHAGGAPKKPFDWNLVDSLLMLEASQEFIAERLLVEDGAKSNKNSIAAKVKLIQRRIKERFDLSFVQYRDKKLEGQKIKLKAAQWKSAIVKENVTMQIWLGKQHLGQTDRIEQKLENHHLIDRIKEAERIAELPVDEIVKEVETELITLKSKVKT